MSTQSRATLKGYFETGDRPTQSQFGDLIDSFLALAAGESDEVVGDHEFSGTTIFNILRLSGDTTPTTSISGAAITATGSYMRVDTSGGAAEDLETINGGVNGMLLLLESFSNARDVTVKDNVGNIQLTADFTLSVRADKLLLIYNSGLSQWQELARTDMG